MFYGGEQTDQTQRRYRRHYSEDGSMEITNDRNVDVTAFTFYLGGDAYTAPAIWKEEFHIPSGQSRRNLYYLHRDYQGTILQITNATGQIQENRLFDAWGNLVKLTNSTGIVLSNFFITDRGYTGHEHLLSVGIIHMNGRLYDPLLHRFLSPDNYVQDPSNTQNFNRYGYGFNNPFKYTDPTGEVFKLIPFLISAAISAAKGAAIAAVVYTASVAMSDGGFKNWSWSSFGKAVGMGAISGMVTAGIGHLDFGTGFGEILGRAMAHGFANSIIAVATGEDFVSSFVSASLGSLGASGFQQLGDFGTNVAGTYFSGALFGGIGAELSGGEFWKGAAQGAIIAGLNHLGNYIQEKIAKTAEKYVGSQDWSYEGTKSNFGEGTNKCNLFAYDVTTEAGAGPGLPNKMLGFKSSPPTAGQWADPNYKIKGWKIVSSPRRGDVAAFSYKYSDASGHVGIMNSSRTSIGANHTIVRQTDFGYSSSHLPQGAKYVYRRYVGR
jgi:RHS repeat-associated protein